MSFIKTTFAIVPCAYILLWLNLGLTVLLKVGPLRERAEEIAIVAGAPAIYPYQTGKMKIWFGPFPVIQAVAPIFPSLNASRVPYPAGSLHDSNAILNAEQQFYSALGMPGVVLLMRWLPQYLQFLLILVALSFFTMRRGFVSAPVTSFVLREFGKDPELQRINPGDAVVAAVDDHEQVIEFGSSEGQQLLADAKACKRFQLTQFVVQRNRHRFNVDASNLGAIFSPRFKFEQPHETNSFRAVYDDFSRMLAIAYSLLRLLTINPFFLARERYLFLNRPNVFRRSKAEAFILCWGAIVFLKIFPLPYSDSFAAFHGLLGGATGSSIILWQHVLALSRDVLVVTLPVLAVGIVATYFDFRNARKEQAMKQQVAAKV